MRTALVETLHEIAARDERIMLLTADLGWSVLERFAASYPDRFINVGVAEQNMLGVATGLALEGYIPFVYSIATFSSMRCYEQLRDGGVLHQLPIRVVGIGGGFAYGHAGPTHYALEDLAIGRAQPGLTVIAPADRSQARTAIRKAVELAGPIYLRIDKSNDPDLPRLNGAFDLDTPELIQEGRELLFLTTGSISHEVVKAAERLKQFSGITVGVAVLAHLGFQGSHRLRDILRLYRAVVTVEEGYVVGGLGSLVSETVAQAGISCRVFSQGVRSPLSGLTGSTEYMRRHHGLDANSLALMAEEFVQRRSAA